MVDFFVECDHLRDWLKGDMAALLVSAADIHAHFKASRPLAVCNAICNSHKHHTRSSGTTARIRETSLHPDGRGSLTIEIDWANPAATTVDALALAEECVSSWRSFFAAHGIVAT